MKFSRSVLAVVAGGLLAVPLSVVSQSRLAASQEATSRPNIVLIVTDDQDLDSMPVMRNLMARPEGSWVNFTNAFVNHAVCCPSRATMLTGRYAHNHGVLGNSLCDAMDENNTLPVWLNDAGYETALIGKYLNNGVPRTPPPGWDIAKGADVKGNEDWLSDQAVAFVNESTSPFLLYLAYGAPHRTAKPPTRYQNVNAYVPPDRPSFNEADFSDKPITRALLKPPEIEANRIERLNAQRELLAVDDGVQRIIDALKAKGQLENTMIVYVSDHGYEWGSHRNYGKLCPYEDCTRVPLMVRFPGLAGNVEEARLASNVDLAWTIADFAGVAPRVPQDGRSLLPILNGNAINWTNEVLLERHNPSFYGIRTQQWKYINHLSGSAAGKQELYDLVNDPYELENLAGKAAYQTIQNQMAQKLQALLDKPPVLPPLVTLTPPSTVSPTPSSTPTLTFTSTPTETPSPAPTHTHTPEPSNTPTDELSPTPSETPKPASTPTETPGSMPTDTPEPDSTPTDGPSPIPSETPEHTSTPVETASPTNTPEPPGTPTETPSPVPSQTPEPSDTPTEMPSSTPSHTPEPSATSTEVPSATPTSVPTTTATPPGSAGTKALVSMASDGRVAGLAFTDEDILAYDVASRQWSLFFDGSRFGLGPADIDAFHDHHGQFLLISLDNPLSLPGLGTVDDSDIVRFVPASPGDYTAGQFERYFDGSAAELTTAGEDIDAIALLPDGRLLVSLTADSGRIKIGSAAATPGDEDILAFTGQTGNQTNGAWSWYFQGSSIGLTVSAEDVNAVDVSAAQDVIYLSTQSDFILSNGLSGTRADIVACHTNSGAGSALKTCDNGIDIYLHGRTIGLGRKLIDGVQIVIP